MEGRLPAFLDTGVAARETPEIVETRPPNFAASYGLNRLDHRRVQQERSLDADLMCNAAHSERTARPPAPLTDGHTFEQLSAFVIAFLHSNGDTHRIAGLKLFDGRVGLQCDEVVCVHLISFLMRVYLLLNKASFYC